MYQFGQFVALYAMLISLTVRLNTRVNMIGARVENLLDPTSALERLHGKEIRAFCSKLTDVQRCSNMFIDYVINVQRSRVFRHPCDKVWQS